MSKPKHLSNLRPTKDNPRIFTSADSELMDKQLAEFGPLDGIVYNTNPAINELVTANQRTKKFKELEDAAIVIEHRYDNPTPTGTVAEGYVRVAGERWQYREVDWPWNKHKAGVVAANNAGGGNDNDALAEYALDIDDVFKGLMSIDFDDLQPDPFDTEPLAEIDKPKSKKFTVEQLRKFAKNKWTAQPIILEFIDWLDDEQN